MVDRKGDGRLASWELCGRVLANASRLDYPHFDVYSAGLIALATGTSWGTMAILFPIVIPLVASHQGLPEFGDFVGRLVDQVAQYSEICSPISDTTVLSSIACASDHVDHVNTGTTHLPVRQSPSSLATSHSDLGFAMAIFSDWLGVTLRTRALLRAW